MTKDIEKIIKNPLKLLEKIDKEFQEGYDHVKLIRAKKRKVEAKILRQPTKKGNLESRALWMAQTLWLATTNKDGIDVEFTLSGGSVGYETSLNTNKVAKGDYKAMGLKRIDWDVRDNVGKYGLGCKAFIGWDNITKKPIVESVDPLIIIPDPHNCMYASESRYVGFQKRVDIYSLLNNDTFFGIDKIIERGGKADSDEIDNNEESLYTPNGYTVPIKDNIIDIYFHYTFFNNKKYLVCTTAENNILIKIEELKPKTKAEKQNPYLIKNPVVFYRSKPISKNLFFGASFHDEIGQFADAEQILDTLEIMLARRVALGSDRFINTSIIDIKTLKNKPIGGRDIPVKLGDKDNINNFIFQEPVPNVGNLPQYVSSKISKKMEETTPVANKQQYGISQQGPQTKGEISILQQNIDILLAYSVDNLMESERDFWKIWYSYYVYNLHPNSKKFITLTKGRGVKDFFNFKKKDFILDVELEVEVESKEQKRIKREKDFARKQILNGTILPNLKEGSLPFLKRMRSYLIDGSGDEEYAMDVFPYTIDEIKANEGLTILNFNTAPNIYEKPNSPKQGENFDVFIDVYSKAPDSDAKNDILQEYINAKKEEVKTQMQQLPPMEENGQVDNVAKGQIGNALISQGI